MSAEDWFGSGWWWREALVAAIGATILVAGALADPSDSALYVNGWEVPELCVVKLSTGYSCPGCGITRSITYLVHGQVWDSLRLHPLGVVVFVGVVGQLPYRLVGVFGGPSGRERFAAWIKSKLFRRLA